VLEHDVCESTHNEIISMMRKVYKSAIEYFFKGMLYKKYAALHAQDCSDCVITKNDECALASTMPSPSKNCQDSTAKKEQHDTDVFNFADEFQREFDAAIEQDKTAYSCVSSRGLASTCDPCLQSDMRAYLNARDAFFTHMLSVLVKQEALASREPGYVEKTHEHLQHAWTCIINDWWQTYTLHDNCYPDVSLLPLY